MADGYCFIALRTSAWSIIYLSQLKLKCATNVITFAFRIGEILCGLSVRLGLVRVHCYTYKLAIDTTLIYLLIYMADASPSLLLE